MKSSRLFIVVIIALMVVVILFEMNAPARFNWDDHSQSYKSKQPFGCYVMDSVLRASLPHGYEVLGSDIKQYIGENAKPVKHTFLFTNSFEDFIWTQDSNFLKMIEEGNNAIIATNYNMSYYDDSTEGMELGYKCYSNNYYYDGDYFSKESLSINASYDTAN